jgi:hypothetical protein
MNPEKKNIIDFDTHILENIAKFVPQKDRRNLSLTCNVFHEVVCRVEEFQFKMKITEGNVS